MQKRRTVKESTKIEKKQIRFSNTENKKKKREIYGGG
jgi:hypothetical protein